MTINWNAAFDSMIQLIKAFIDGVIVPFIQDTIIPLISAIPDWVLYLTAIIAFITFIIAIFRKEIKEWIDNHFRR